MGLSAITSPHTSQKRISLPQSHALCSKLYFSTYYNLINVHILCVSPPSGFPRWRSGKKPTRHCRRCRFDPWVRKIPWRRAWQPTSIFLPGEAHRQRSLVGYSPWGHKESDTTEHTHTHYTSYPRVWGFEEDGLPCNYVVGTAGAPSSGTSFVLLPDTMLITFRGLPFSTLSPGVWAMRSLCLPWCRHSPHQRLAPTSSQANFSITETGGESAEQLQEKISLLLKRDCSSK